MESATYKVDNLPLSKKQEEEDKMTFNIYLLGHDSCANHTISFERTSTPNFSMDWNGLIALTYGEFETFDHQFNATITDATFEGFHYPQSWTLEEATLRFKKVLLDFDSFEFIDLNPKSNKREYKLMLQH